MTSPHMFTIRMASHNDLDTLVSFNTAMAEETEARALDTDRVRRGVSAILESPGKGFYLVGEAPREVNAPVVSQLMITFEWSDWRNGMFWWIQSVYVHPAWRRRGAFRQMHTWVLQHAKSQPDICGLRLYVESGNHLAQRIYAQVGLTPLKYQMYEEDFIFPKKE